MARLRNPETTPQPADAVPLELLDYHHQVWQDNESAAAWRRLHGLPQTAPTVLEFVPGPHSPPGRGGRIRHDRALHDWAIATDVVRKGNRGDVDWERVRELTGIGRLTAMQRCASRAGYEDLP